MRLLAGPPISLAMGNASWLPLAAADPRPDLGVRVQRDARPPAPWSWAIHREGEPVAVRRSEEHYRGADDALDAGRRALAAMKACG
jgi:hypothetical protein